MSDALVSQARLLIATRNPGKVREFRRLLQDVPYELVSLEDLGITEEVEETGETFAENARLKASAYAALGGLLTLADDSGLEVDALGGEPGVRSARYGEESPPNQPEEKTDRDRLELLLHNMRGVPWDRRTARFRCVIAVATPPGSPFVRGGIVGTTRAGARDMTLVAGAVAGMIQYNPLGEEGFGYDPVFYLPSYGLTMAQLFLEEKNLISHRADAARKAETLLKSIFISHQQRERG
ncbi:MAG: non-canonical purine NTP pyrophosphatase [Dehalococcoidia bacterium]|nr:non-canonical purine NTP pyrophosphatase [Dehalococcoidia bacterium]